MTFSGQSIINDYPQKLCVSSIRVRLIVVSDIDVHSIKIPGSEFYTTSFFF